MTAAWQRPCPPLDVVRHALGLHLAVQLHDTARARVELRATLAALAVVHHELPAAAGTTTEEEHHVPTAQESA